MAKKKKTRSKAAYVVGKVFKYLFLTLFAVILICGCVGLGAFFGIKMSAPELKNNNVTTSSDPSVILDDAGNEIIQLSSWGARRTEATSEEIPDNLRWAFVDLEDERFYEHNGIDKKGILRAVYITLTTSRKEGASTITQQLVKNTVFETQGMERSTGSSLRRKIQEWFLAMDLEKEMSKEEILLSYMNTISLGAGNYGVKAAASYYFGKEVSDLTLAECAVIASITQNPSANNPARFPDNNKERAQKCLKQMYENGHITYEEYSDALDEDVYSRIVAVATQTAGSSIYSYYVDSLIEQVMEDLQEELGYTYAQAYNTVFAGGLTIYSNQNAQAQAIIDQEVNNPDNYQGIETSYSFSLSLTVLKADGSAKYYSQADLTTYYKWIYGTDWILDFPSKEAAQQAIDDFKAAVVEKGDTVTNEAVYFTLEPQASFTLMDYNTGKVLAISGGRGEKETSLSFNRATDSYRQPGSTFKIVSTFAPALELGKVTLATTFDDEPFRYSDSGKYVSNWWGDSYWGLCTIRMAIQESMNVITCKTLLYIGAENAVKYLRKFGYSKILDSDAALSTAIGGITKGVSNLENCAAYSAIANGGEYMEPKFYSKIVTKDGSILLDAETIQDRHQVVSVETCSLLTSAMQDVVLYGTGQDCAISSAPLAGKTGTTNDYNDLWFVGYVPNGLCSALWVGYDDSQTMEANNTVQKKFYSNIMDKLVSCLGREGGEFTMEGNIVTATVCSSSGKLSNGLCEQDQIGSKLRQEYFVAGTVPTVKCDVHVQYSICDETNKLANKYCEKTTVKVLRRRIDPIDNINYQDDAHDGTTLDSPYVVPEKCTTHSEKTTTTESTTTKETTTKETTTKETTEETTSEEPDTEPDTEPEPEPTAEEPTEEEP